MQEVTATPTAFLVSWQSYGCRVPQVPGAQKWYLVLKKKVPGAGSSKERWPHLSPPPSLHIPPHNPLKNDKDDEVVLEMVITMRMIEK